MEEEPARAIATARGLHERVLQLLLLWLSAGNVLTGSLLLLHAQLNDLLEPKLAVGATSLFLVPLLALLQRRLGYRRCAVLLILCIFAISSFFQSYRGPIAGTVLGSVVVWVMSGMFFGARGVVWGALLSLLSLLVSAALILSGWIQPLPEAFWDPRQPLVWIRYAFVFVSYAGGVANALVLLIGGLERAHVELAQTLERERQERRQRTVVQHAFEQAQRIDAIGQFAAGMAHDFNNTLMVIMGDASLIRAEPEVSAQVATLSDEILARAQLASDSIRQLLSLGRDDVGKPVSMRLDAVLRRSLPTLQQAVGRNVCVQLECRSDAVVMVDVGRLQQALLNLALNARDAMPTAGCWTLRVDERQVSQSPVGWTIKPGTFVCLTCTDTGIGLDVTLLDKIFEPFFTTKEPGKGTGLGLAMVRKTLVDANGFIETASSPGSGTSFRLYFPRCEVSEVAAQPVAIHAAPPSL